MNQAITGPLAIIGGSGLYDLDAMKNVEQLDMKTPYGETSSPLMSGLWQDREVIFLTRHGVQHNLAPHALNYRANIWGLHQAGAKAVISINCVGGIHPALRAPGTLCAPDQFLDYSWGRDATFFSAGEIKHVDMTDPCDSNLRASLLAAGCDFEMYQRGCCYAVMQGPRLETRAEVKRLQQDGADIVGMTAMPEIALIRELELPVAVLSLVINPAAGLGVGTIQAEVTTMALAQGMKKIKAFLGSWLAA